MTGILRKSCDDADADADATAADADATNRQPTRRLTLYLLLFVTL